MWNICRPPEKWPADLRALLSAGDWVLVTRRGVVVDAEGMAAPEGPAAMSCGAAESIAGAQPAFAKDIGRDHDLGPGRTHHRPGWAYHHDG